MRAFLSQLTGTQFLLSLALFLTAGMAVWLRGYRLVGWMARQGMAAKVAVAAALVAAVVAVGCFVPLSVGSYGIWLALPFSIALVATAVLAVAVVSAFRREEAAAGAPTGIGRRQQSLQLLAKTMVWIWSWGWVLYFVAIAIGRQPHVGAELLLRSAVGALDLFLLDVDSNIYDAIQHYAVLKGLLTTASFAAALCTALLVISLVLARLRAWLHVRHLLPDSRHDHLYLFFGMSDGARLLADDVYASDPRSIIVFIEQSLDSEGAADGGDDADGWKSIMSMLTHRRRTFRATHEDNRRALAIANAAVSSLDGDRGQQPADLFHCLGLDAVGHMVSTLDSLDGGELHIFFLADDAHDNVLAATLMATDRSVQSPAFATTIYCRAPRSGVNSAIEDLGLPPERRVALRLLDTAHLAVEDLKTHRHCHPVNFVDVETLADANPGTVSSPFVSLVIGFGQTGQEAVRFLYEYGAFASNTSSTGEALRSPFSCHVVDQAMATIEGTFMASVPGASCQPVAAAAATGRQSAIVLHHCPFGSAAFYDEVLSPIVEELNYVVVALGSDELNMAVAVELLSYTRRRRADLSHFCIFCRAYEESHYRHLEQTADHYRRQLGESHIVLFGRQSNIFSHRLIVDDAFLKQGQQYYENYRRLNVDPDNDEGTWEERRQATLQGGKGTPGERRSRLRRKETQDRSNALHAMTKVLLFERAATAAQAPLLARRMLAQRPPEGQPRHCYPQLTPQQQRLMLNMAMGEHIRWNASHEMLGYTGDTDAHYCDERTKRHNCLKPWSALDQESANAGYKVNYKVFDFGVVETTLKQEYDRGEDDKP